MINFQEKHKSNAQEVSSSLSSRANIKPCKLITCRVSTFKVGQMSDIELLIT